MQHHKMTSRFAAIRLGLTCALPFLICLGTAQASIVQSYIVTPGFAGPEFAAGTNAVARDGEGYSAAAQSFIGINKVYSLSAATAFQQIQARSFWQADFDLFGAPEGTPVTLVMHLAYDLTLTLGGIGSADLGFDINGNHFNPYQFYTILSGGATFADHCVDKEPGVHETGYCAGTHSGVFDIVLNYTTGTGKTLSVSEALDTTGFATGDAFHTIQVLGITVPDGYSWAYTDLQGNPLNFQNETLTSETPEPGTAGLVGVALGALALLRRRSCKS